MWLTPASIARRSTFSAVSRSFGGPNTPGPGSCIAPKPRRRTNPLPSATDFSDMHPVYLEGSSVAATPIVGRLQSAASLDLCRRPSRRVGPAYLPAISSSHGRRGGMGSRTDPADRCRRGADLAPRARARGDTLRKDDTVDEGHAASSLGPGAEPLWRVPEESRLRRRSSGFGFVMTS